MSYTLLKYVALRRMLRLPDVVTFEEPFRVLFVEDFSHFVNQLIYVFM